MGLDVHQHKAFYAFSFTCSVHNLHLLFLRQYLLIIIMGQTSSLTATDRAILAEQRVEGYTATPPMSPGEEDGPEVYFLPLVSLFDQMERKLGTQCTIRDNSSLPEQC